MYRFFIKGVVQGVGFRPYIYNACVKEGIKGYVQNTGNGVVAVVSDKEKFIEILMNKPPLARIDSWEAKEEENYKEEDFKGFSIIKSEGKGFAEVPPDLYLCEDCLRELKDPKNRRKGYFFITCTNCGPRFSIAEESPYDRKTTSMKDFEMCPTCKAEYENPTDRRYHAQTIACQECGPKIRLYSNGQETGSIEEAAELLKKGETVAIKGVGGFHLACKLNSAKRLRQMTRREHKPYAIMVKDIKMAKQYAEITEKEKELLESIERPITLLKKKKEKKEELRLVSELDTIGVMLPYTALHYLLFEHLDEPLVMTSSNMPDYPITTEKEQQFTTHILDHDRRITNHVDDSVVKVIGGKKLFLRRSRGYVPRSIELDLDDNIKEDIIALGAEMNSTFCIVKDGKAILSQYQGNTANYDSFENYKKSIKKMLKMTNCKPKAVICDMHPEYNTSLYAQELAEEYGAKVVRVQHHLAHAYSVAAEHKIKDFTAIVADGLGYGPDGTIWGGEIFINGERAAHLEEQPQIGGDAATRSPARMLMGILSKILTKKELRRRMLEHYDGEMVTVLERQLETGFNVPKTTSCGRILDAAAVFLGLCDRRTYDGRPAMLLEANSGESYEIEPVIYDNTLMTTPLFRWLILNEDKDKKRLAATVQEYLAKGMYKLAKEYGNGKPVLLSGGCAYSHILTSYMLSKGVLINEKVPAGDGGISFGQAVYYAQVIAKKKQQ